MVTALHVDVAYALESMRCVVGVRVVPADDDGDRGPVELLVALSPCREREKYEVARALWPIVGRPGMAAVAFWDAEAGAFGEPRYVRRATPLVLTPAQRREAASRARDRERDRDVQLRALAVGEDLVPRGSGRVGSRRVVLDEDSRRCAVVLVAATPEDASGLLHGAVDLVVCDARSWSSLCRVTREGQVLPAILRVVVTPDVAPSAVAEMVAEGAVVVRAADLTEAVERLVADAADGRTRLDVVLAGARPLASGDAAWYRR